METLCRIEKYLAMLGIVVLTLCIFLGAVARTIGEPLRWTTDIGMFMLTWATFLAGDIAFREGRLSNLDILVAKFPVAVQKAVAVAIYLLIVIFLILIIYFGTQLTYSTRFRTFNGVANFSYSWVTASMPVSALFMVITAIGRLIGLLKSSDQDTIAKM